MRENKGKNCKKIAWEHYREISDMSDIAYKAMNTGIDELTKGLSELGIKWDAVRLITGHGYQYDYPILLLKCDKYLLKITWWKVPRTSIVDTDIEIIKLKANQMKFFEDIMR